MRLRFNFRFFNNPRILVTGGTTGFHASSLPCLHTFWHAILTSLYIFNVFFLFSCILFDGREGNMAGYCTSVQPYFHEPQASENTVQECNIQPYYLLNHQIKDLLYTTLILVASRK